MCVGETDGNSMINTMTPARYPLFSMLCAGRALSLVLLNAQHRAAPATLAALSLLSQATRRPGRPQAGYRQEAQQERCEAIARGSRSNLGTHL